MRIEEYSRFFDVPLLRAGTFIPRNTNGQAVSYTEEELDAMARDSNEVLDFIRESIETGHYRGNDIDLAGKPIPNLINIIHQDYLPVTMKDVMKDVTASFGKKVINGVTWLTGTIENIPQEWAKFIKDKLPYRSVEVLSNLTHPDTGKTYPQVIRSIGFLDALTRPAVGGQSPEFAVEFVEDDGPLTVLFPQFINPVELEGEINMAEHQKHQNASPPPKAELTPELEATLKQQEQKLVEMQAKLDANEREKGEIKEALEKERRIREFSEVDMYCKSLMLEHAASPVFIEMIKNVLIHSDDHQVIEFAEDQKVTQRHALKDLFRKIVTMKKDDILTVPLQELGAGTHPRTEDTQETIEARQLRRVAEFADQARHLVSDPTNQNQVYQKALELALDAYGDTI
jgi:hypothetical protein